MLSDKDERKDESEETDKGPYNHQAVDPFKDPTA
jgi:hypothetical protein